MTHYTIMVPVESRDNIWSFIHPFTSDVWILLLITIPILILTMILSNYYVNIPWAKLVSFVLRFIMVQDGRYPYKIINLKGSKSQKLLGMIWIVACFILIQSYDGNLTAMLTRPTLEKTIKTVEDLVQQTHIEWSSWGDGMEITEYLKQSPPGSPLKRLHDQSKSWIMVEGEPWHSACFTIRTWNSGKDAAICDSKSTKSTLSKDFGEDGLCNFYMIDNTFFTVPAVMAFQVSIT